MIKFTLEDMECIETALKEKVERIEDSIKAMQESADNAETYDSVLDDSIKGLKLLYNINKAELDKFCLYREDVTTLWILRARAGRPRKDTGN